METRFSGIIGKIRGLSRDNEATRRPKTGNGGPKREIWKTGKIRENYVVAPYRQLCYNALFGLIAGESCPRRPNNVLISPIKTPTSVGGSLAVLTGLDGKKLNLMEIIKNDKD